MTASATVLRESLDSLVAAAVRAPSPHNSQPWRFRLREGGLELLADRSRVLPVIDPHGRQLTIACGAALFNLRLAVSRLGYEPDVTLIPDPGEPDLLARVRARTARPVPEEDERLYAAMHRRHTHRGAFDDRPLPPGLLAALVEAAEQEGGRLHLVTDVDERAQLSVLIAAAEEAQQRDPEYREELAAWTPAPGSERRDGVPPLAYAEAPRGPFAIRDFALGRGWGRLVDLAPDPAPVVAVLSTPGDRPEDWLLTGQSLERALLTAAGDWVFASFFGQPTELPTMRSLLRAQLRIPGWPQIVLRMGYAPVAPTTARRAVDAVLDPDPPSRRT